VPGNLDYRQLLAEFESTEFVELWPAQDSALAAYSAKHAASRDIAVELPTGAGKTLIALLVAEAWRREQRPAAILTANKTLARQMEGEAAALGIKVVRMEGTRDEITPMQRRAYQRASAVGIMNYWVYFNQNPAIDPASLLIMDDAHLAEHCLHSLFSVEVDRFEHPTLFSSVVHELARRFPDYGVIQDALDEAAPPVASAELVSFLDQESAAARLREIFDASPDTAADTDLRFRWGRTRDHLMEANLYISHGSLWLRPAVYPLIDNPYYAQADQRLYLSATIGDTGDLARRLGTHQITKIEIPREHRETTYGRRMLVLNTSEHKTIPDRMGKVLLAALAGLPKSVWLCASKNDAVGWRQGFTAWLNDHSHVNEPTWLLTSLGNEIDQFKAAAAGHLFVGGRFDGMDFKADECRLVVLATLPRAINLQEEFYTAYLRDAGFMLRRRNQRIIQSLGRCNRAPDDFAIYILADPRFAVHLGRESQRVGLPRNVVAEIDAAEDATELPDDVLVKSVERFLGSDFDAYDRELLEQLNAVPDELTEEPDEDSSDEVAAWLEMYQRQNYRRAAEHFNAALESSQAATEIAAFLRWCEAKAMFLGGRQGDRAATESALQLFERAIGHGRSSSWFNRQRSSLNRYLASRDEVGTEPGDDYAQSVLRVFDDRLEDFGTKDTKFQRWVDRVSAALESEHHNEFLSGLSTLGEMLGYTATRPRHTAATDCRWRGVFGNAREVITFEAKVEHALSSVITPSDVGQAHNQLARAEQEFGERGFTIRGTIVTHLEGIDPAAASSLGPIIILRKGAVQELWQEVVGNLANYRDRWAVDDVDARKAAAASVIPNLPPAGWLSRALAFEDEFIGGDILLTEWS
jgi:tetratricopeptide (TPR) repeat protein